MFFLTMMNRFDVLEGALGVWCYIAESIDQDTHALVYLSFVPVIARSVTREEARLLVLCIFVNVAGLHGIE